MKDELYPEMHKIIKPKKKGNVQIIHNKIDEQMSNVSFIKQIANQGHPLRPCSYTPPGTYVQLMVDGQIMMSDTLMERMTNAHFVMNAHGDVLIGGLGIGMVVAAVFNQPHVQSVTVVEINKHVVDCVLPGLNKHLTKEQQRNLTIIEGDIHEILDRKEIPGGQQEFDCIYFDIWPEISNKNYTEFIRLRWDATDRLKGTKTSFISGWLEHRMTEVIYMEECAHIPVHKLQFSAFDQFAGAVQ